MTNIINTVNRLNNEAALIVYVPATASTLIFTAADKNTTLSEMDSINAEIESGYTSRIISSEARFAVVGGEIYTDVELARMCKNVKFQ
jgi:hypothetical protein